MLRQPCRIHGDKSSGTRAQCLGIDVALDFVVVCRAFVASKSAARWALLIAALVANGGIARANVPAIPGIDGTEPGHARMPWVEPIVPPLTEPAIDRRWYGWKTLLLDGATGLVGSLAIANYGSQSFPMLAAAATTSYVLGPPFIHFAHGHVLKGIGSFGLRVAAPLLLGGLGIGIGFRFGNYELSDVKTGLILAGVGAGVGAVLASALDAAFIANEDVLPAPPVVPVVSRSANGTPIVGLAAAF